MRQPLFILLLIPFIGACTKFSLKSGPNSPSAQFDETEARASLELSVTEVEKERLAEMLRSQEGTESSDPADPQ